MNPTLQLDPLGYCHHDRYWIRSRRNAKTWYEMFSGSHDAIALKPGDRRWFIVSTPACAQDVVVPAQPASTALRFCDELVDMLGLTK